MILNLACNRKRCQSQRQQQLQLHGWSFFHIRGQSKPEQMHLEEIAKSSEIDFDWAFSLVMLTFSRFSMRLNKPNT